MLKAITANQRGKNETHSKVNWPIFGTTYLSFVIKRRNVQYKANPYVFIRLCTSTGRWLKMTLHIARVTILCLFLRFVLIFKGNVLENVNVLISKKRAYF